MELRENCGSAFRFTLIFSVGGLLSIAGCSESPPPAAEVVRPVKTMIVTGGDPAKVRSFAGTVQASRQVELAFRVAGWRIRSLRSRKR